MRFTSTLAKVSNLYVCVLHAAALRHARAIPYAGHTGVGRKQPICHAAPPSNAMLPMQ